MSDIHDEMEAWGQWCKCEGDETLRARLGVEPATPGATGVAEALEVLGDGEAHTVQTIDEYLNHAYGMELSGCQIAALLGRLELDGYSIKMLGPYDIFGSPGRFKLESDQ